MKKNPYKNFQKFVLRTPLFSIEYFKKLTSKNEISDTSLKKVFANPIVKEAIFLASPTLYEELDKWARGQIKESTESTRLKHTLLKYISRMCSRCTPFGLFAGCSVGSIDSNTCIEINGANDNSRSTRLDMNYVVALMQDLAKNKDIREQLLFYPNSSIYKHGNDIRYVEYNYLRSRRFHNLMEVENFHHLEQVLESAANGILLKDLLINLVDDDLDKEEVLSFIDEIINNQLLVSELEPSISGPELIHQIKEILAKVKGSTSIINIIEQVDLGLKELDKCIGNNPNFYINISEKLNRLGTDFEMKYLFQTDTIIKATKNIISQDIVDAVREGISVLNKLTLPNYNTRLEKFTKAFVERFGAREILLSKALDLDSGIGYKEEQGYGEINPLIDDLFVGTNSSQRNWNLQYSPIDAFLQMRINEALASNKFVVQLSDEDLKSFKEDWTDLPDTISSIIQYVIVDGEERIKLCSASGSSAATLFSRFCHGDEQLLAYVNEIIAEETKMNEDKIIAEIVHLPESRLGNILMRPELRDFEIPYLAKSVLPSDNHIPLSDLYVSVEKNKKIVLRSKKLNKEIIPRLTNAHNYSKNSLPIYHFLCDLQTQGMRASFSFSRSNVNKTNFFLPRFEYKNLILNEATWNLSGEDINHLMKEFDNDKELLVLIDQFRKNTKLPQFVLLVEGDNELLINLKNLMSTRMFLSSVKKKNSFILKEFFFEEKGIVRDNNNQYFSNQIVLSFYNNNKSINAKP